MNVYLLGLEPWKRISGGGVSYSGGQEVCVCLKEREGWGKKVRTWQRKSLVQRPGKESFSLGETGGLQCRDVFSVISSPLVYYCLSEAHRRLSFSTNFNKSSF